MPHNKPSFKSLYCCLFRKNKAYRQHCHPINNQKNILFVNFYILIYITVKIYKKENIMIDKLKIIGFILCMAVPAFGQAQTPSAGVWENGTVTAKIIADPVTGMARFGSTSSAVDVDIFTSRHLFLSNDNGLGPTPRLTLNSNGKIGINTVTPQKVFEVQTLANDTAAFGRTLAIGEWTGIQLGYLEPWNSFYRKSAIVFQRTDATAARGKLMFLNNTAADASPAGVGDAKLTISENGDIGIGTTAPSSTLHLDVASGPVIRLSRGNKASRFDLETNGTNLMIGPRDSGDLILTSGAFIEGLRLKSNGNVGIGTSFPSEKLTVKGGILASKIKVVPAAEIPDFVFDPNYRLQTLDKLRTFIKTYRHLPNVPSEKEFKKLKALDIFQMDMKLLEKIEELTLYLLQADQRISALERLLKEAKRL
jgi:hypothetical protein